MHGYLRVFNSILNYRPKVVRTFPIIFRKIPNISEHFRGISKDVSIVGQYPLLANVKTLKYSISTVTIKLIFLYVSRSAVREILVTTRIKNT